MNDNFHNYFTLTRIFTYLIAPRSFFYIKEKSGQPLRLEKAVRHVCYFEKSEIRQLIFQTIRIQEKILHSHNDKAFIVPPGFLTPIYNDDLLKRVRDTTQRMELLRLFFF